MKKILLITLVSLFSCGVNINHIEKWGVLQTERLEKETKCDGIHKEQTPKICECVTGKLKQMYDPIDFESILDTPGEKQAEFKKFLRDFYPSECKDLDYK